MSTPKHTPGPIHNGRPCTCCILLRTGEPLESVHGDQPCSDISRIELCPKHAAAPAMYEALQQSLVLVELAALEEWGRAVRGEQQPPTTEARDRLEKVKAALAQAEGCKI